MTFFEYISVMVSVILALGIARLLGGLGELLVRRASKRTYWVHSLWMLLYSLLHIRTRDDAKADLFDYIEMFYNRNRRHSHLGGVSPEAFEEASLSAS